MSRLKQVAWASVAVLVAFVLFSFRSEGPRKVREAFAGHLYHERYAEAALMLRGPSALEVAADGGLIVVDHFGESTVVPPENLPFKVAEVDQGPEHDLAMGALRDGGPFVFLYLRVDDGKVRIVGTGR